VSSEVRVDAMFARMVPGPTGMVDGVATTCPEFARGG